MSPAGTNSVATCAPVASLVAILLWAGAACTNARVAACKKDVDCSALQACIGESCVFRRPSRPATWAVEVVPPSETNYSAREFVDISFTADAAVFSADYKATVSGVIDREDGEGESGSVGAVRVVALVPSLIPTRRDLSFETEGTIARAGGAIDFALPVPSAAMGKAAKMWLWPSSQIDRLMPPWQTSIVVGPELRVRILNPNEVLFIEGTLLTAIGEPVTNYLARAQIAGRVVSNSAASDETGRFKLRVQRALLPAGSSDGLTITLAPADVILARPRLVAHYPGPGTQNSWTLRLPPFAQPEVFNVPVAASGSGMGIAGATVRFRTTLTGAMGGDAVYEREALTGADGTAQIMLVPGIGGLTQDYSVIVTPPQASSNAARCLAAYGVAASTGGTRVSASLALSPKVDLSGDVRRADGALIANVRVTATREDSLAAPCGTDVASQPASALTDRKGVYHLPVEPGRYRLDFEPPLGSPCPQFTEMAVDANAAIVHNVTLPVGFLVEGRVLSPMGSPIPNCQVRVFKPETGRDLQSVAVARSGDDGRFRVMLAE